MKILEARSYGQPKPVYQAEIVNGERIALYHDTSSVSYEEFLGDCLGVQTLRIADRLRPMASNDGETEAINEIYDRLGSNTEALQAAITKHFERQDKTCVFLDLNGYSQGEWCEVVLYANKTDIYDWPSVIAEVRSYWRGDVFTAALEKLKVYTASDFTQIGEWEAEDQIVGVILSDYWGQLKDGTPDYELLAADLFGITTPAGSLADSTK